MQRALIFGAGLIVGLAVRSPSHSAAAHGTEDHQHARATGGSTVSDSVLCARHPVPLPDNKLVLDPKTGKRPRTWSEKRGSCSTG